MDAISKNLRTLVDGMGVKQGVLARVAGVTDGSVSFWLSGKVQPRPKALERIAAHYGLTIDDLTSDSNGLYARYHEAVVPRAAVEARASNAHAVLLGRVHAGDMREPDVLDDSVPIPSDILDSHPRGYFLEVEGTCMDKVLPPGCVVLVDPDKEPHNGAIAVVSVDGSDYIIRRIYRGSNSVLLVADSHSEWEDIVVDDGHQVETYGTVVWFQSRGELR